MVLCKPGDPDTAERTIMLTHLQAAHARVKLALVDDTHYVNKARVAMTKCLDVAAGGGDWADLLVKDIAQVREYLLLAIDMLKKSDQILLSALRLGEVNMCSSYVENLKAIMTEGHELLLKAWNNLVLAYHTATKAATVHAHFQGGGSISGLIKQAQASASNYMKATSELIQSAGNVTWGSIGGDAQKPAEHILSPRMVKLMAEQKMLPLLRGPKVKSSSFVSHSSTAAFICAQERELRWTPCFQDLCRNEIGSKQSGCMYGCFAVIAQNSQEDDDNFAPLRAKARAALRENGRLPPEQLHRALAAVSSAASFGDLNAVVTTALSSDSAVPVYQSESIGDAKELAKKALAQKYIEKVTCNKADILEKARGMIGKAETQEKLFKVLWAVLSCADPGKDFHLDHDSHGCLHFCTSHVDGVLGHSCESAVSSEVGENFLSSRKVWSRACVFACKERTSSSSFQTAWGEHGGKIQVSPKNEEKKYGGGLPNGDLTRQHIYAGDRWAICNETVCHGLVTLKRSGCMYGCRSMVLTGLASVKECDQYCDETVDQVLADPTNLGAEALGFDKNAEKTEDMKALWVVECKSKCKEAAQYYPPVPKNRHSYELPISKRSKLTKLEQDTVSHVSLHNGGDGVGEENGEGSSEIVYSI
jgi:hypothetical protein